MCREISKRRQRYSSRLFFDVIVTNPPYMLNQHGLQNPGDAKAIARHEILCTLDDIYERANNYLRTGKDGFI